MTAVTIGAIESAIVAAIDAAGTPERFGYAFRQVDSYPDDWEAYLGNRETLGPSAWVTFAGWDKATRMSSGNLRIEGAMFGVTVCGQSKRNERASRQGGPMVGEVGSYQILMDVLLLLSGSDLGLNIDNLEPGPARVVAMPAEKRRLGLSWFAMPFTTDFELAPPDDDTLGDLELVHANWDSPLRGQGPNGPIGALPDDFHADATDIIELEQP